MFTKRTITWAIVIIIILGLTVWLVPNIIKYRSAVQASSGFPYQIGLTKVVIIPCFTIGTPPVCVGGTLCTVKDAATCTLYSDVSGMPAGGMGEKGLFLNTAITKTGLISGGQLIAGGTSPVLMDNGVLASVGGVSYAVSNKVNQTIDFVVALFE